MNTLADLSKRAAVHVFDVDHTLIRHSTGRFFVATGWRSGDFSWRTLAAVPFYYLLYRIGNVTLPAVDREIRFVAGLSKDRLESIAERSYAMRVRPHIYQVARTHVQNLTAAGRTVFAASTSFDFVLKPLLAELGIQGAVATRLEFNAGIATGRIPDGPCYGPIKAERTLRRITELGFAPSDCAFYTDSYHDLPLLGAVGFPVAVHPDKRLSRVARFEGWPVIAWK